MRLSVIVVYVIVSYLANCVETSATAATAVSDSPTNQLSTFKEKLVKSSST